MARAIDADELLKKFAYSPEDTEDEQVFNAAARKIIREMHTLTPPNEEIVDKIDNVTWYTLTEDGKMVEGAPSRRTAWYKARDILSITDKYRRPPEGEADGK